MAQALAADPNAAIRELDKAVALDPSDLATVYRLAAALTAAGSPDAGAMQKRFDASHAVGDADAAPLQFDRAGLLRQVSGVAPIFLPQRYVAGLRLIETGDYAAGIRSWREAAESDPLVASNASAAAMAGARLRLGQLQAALTILRPAMTQSPTPEVQRIAGLAYWADEQYDKSVDVLTSAMRADARDERTRIALADVLIVSGKTADAERLLTETIGVLPESGLAHYRLAELYQSQSLLPRAIAEFEASARCSPLIGLDHLYETIGGLYVMQADFARTVRVYRMRIDVNPNNSEAHRKLGEVYALQGDDTAAVMEFDVAERLDPKNADAFAEAGQTYVRVARFGDAITASRRALALDPTNQKARFTLGTALVRQGDAPAGQRELETFQRETDKAAAARRQIAEVAVLRRDAARAAADGDYAGSASLLQRAAELAPQDRALQIDRAEVLLKAGRPQDALAVLAPPLAGDDADAHRLAAEANTALGRADVAEREQTRYRQLVEERKEQRLKTRPLLR